jgi:plasmid maintenance system antidote protein VapI
LAAEVTARAAAQGLTLTDLAARMGVGKQHLNELFSAPAITERSFLRLSAALGMQLSDWDQPLPRRRTPLEQVRRMRQKVHQIRTEKKQAQLVEPVPDATLNGTGADGAEKG